MNDTRLRVDWKERTIDVNVEDFRDMEHLYDTIYFYWSCNVRTYHGKGISSTPPILRLHERHCYEMNGFTLYINSGDKRFTFTDDFMLDGFDTMIPVGQSAKERGLVTLNDDSSRILDLILSHFGNAPIRVDNMFFWIEQTVQTVIVPLEGDEDRHKFMYDAVCRRVNGIERTLITSKDFNVACSTLSFAISAIEISTRRQACIGAGRDTWTITDCD